MFRTSVRKFVIYLKDKCLPIEIKNVSYLAQYFSRLVFGAKIVFFSHTTIFCRQLSDQTHYYAPTRCFFREIHVQQFIANRLQISRILPYFARYYCRIRHDA